MRILRQLGSRISKKIITKLHVNWGHASARHLKTVLVAPDGSPMGSGPHVDEVLEQCEICRVSDRAAHIPIAGTFAVLMFNEQA